MRETNGIFVASLWFVGGWSGVRPDRARAADSDAADGPEADGPEADGAEAEAEEDAEAGNGDVVARGTEDARSDGGKLQGGGPGQADPGATDCAPGFGAARSEE